MEQQLIFEVQVKFNAITYHNGDGYHYYGRTHKGNRIFLVCAHNKECPGTASMPRAPAERFADRLVLNRHHNHGPEPNWLLIRLARNRMMERSIFERTSFRTIYKEEMNGLDPEALPFKTLSTSMTKARKRMPDLAPATLAQYGKALEACPRYSLTKQREYYKFYRATLVDDGGHSAIVFVSPSLLAQLQHNCSTLQVDTTFRVVPNAPPSCQLLTMSAVMFDHLFPVVSVLFERRTQTVFTLIFSFVCNLFGDWKPEVITCDFEVALQNSLQGCWPEAAVVGSWFHSANSMNRKTKRLGMTDLLRANENAYRAYKMCQALPLLPADDIPTGYEAVVDFGHQHGLMAIPEFVAFMDYVNRVWITGVGSQSFSVYRQKRRTNNGMESYHRKLKDAMNHPHRNIWIFTDGLRTLEREAATTLRRDLQGVRPDQSSYMLADEGLQQLTASLDNGTHTISEFLKEASHYLDNVHNEVYNVPDDFDEPDEEVAGLLVASLPRDIEHAPAPALLPAPAPALVPALAPALVPTPSPAPAFATRGRGRGRGGCGRGFSDRGRCRGGFTPCRQMREVLTSSPSLTVNSGSNLLDKDVPEAKLKILELFLKKYNVTPDDVIAYVRKYLNKSKSHYESISTHLEDGSPAPKRTKTQSFADQVKIEEELTIEDYGDTNDHNMEFEKMHEDIANEGENNTVVQALSLQSDGPFETIICSTSNDQIKQEFLEDETENPTEELRSWMAEGTENPLASTTNVTPNTPTSQDQLDVSMRSKEDPKTIKCLQHSISILKPASSESQNCQVCKEADSSRSELVEHCVLHHSDSSSKFLPGSETKLTQTGVPEIPQFIAASTPGYVVSSDPVSNATSSSEFTSATCIAENNSTTTTEPVAGTISGVATLPLCSGLVNFTDPSSKVLPANESKLTQTRVPEIPQFIAASNPGYVVSSDPVSNATSSSGFTSATCIPENNSTTTTEPVAGTIFSVATLPLCSGLVNFTDPSSKVLPANESKLTQTRVPEIPQFIAASNPGYVVSSDPIINDTSTSAFTSATCIPENHSTTTTEPVVGTISSVATLPLCSGLVNFTDPSSKFLPANESKIPQLISASTPGYVVSSDPIINATSTSGFTSVTCIPENNSTTTTKPVAGTISSVATLPLCNDLVNLTDSSSKVLPVSESKLTQTGVPEFPQFIAATTPGYNVSSDPVISTSTCNQYLLPVNYAVQCSTSTSGFTNATCIPEYNSTTTTEPVCTISSVTTLPNPTGQNWISPYISACDVLDGVYVPLITIAFEKRKATIDKIVELVRYISKGIDPLLISFVIITKK